ncbi:MAG: cytochrome C oxidase subunit IV family protein [Bacteroidetes bacterium]|nr:cytochrome C oxidase subunit IV family protein [Bacteroidota bacterium]
MTIEQGHPNHTKTYLGIFSALAVLTGIEVGVSQMSMPKTAMVILLIALALVKAGLVAVYFMHLKYDARFLKIIAYSPLAVAGILILMISLEWTFQPHWLF